MEITPSEQYLKELLDTLDGLESEEIAGALTQEGLSKRFIRLQPFTVEMYEAR